MKRNYPCICFLLYSFSLCAQQQSPGEIEQLLAGQSSAERIRIVNRYVIENVENNRPGNNRVLFESAVSFARAHNDTLLLKELDYLKLESLEASPAGRIRAYQKIMESPEFRDNALYRGTCLHQIGQNQFVQEEYGLAFQNLLHAQKIFKDIGYENIPNMGKYLHDLALDHYFFKNYGAAIEAMKTSVSLPRFTDNLDIQRYNTLGMAYLKINEPDSALNYLNKTYERAAYYGDSIWMGLASGNIGEVYYTMQAYREALPYFLKNYELNKNIRRHFVIPIEACADLAKAYLKTDSLQKGHRFICLTESYFPENRPFNFGERQQFEINKRQHYENFYQYYLKSADYKNALLYQDSLVKLENDANSKYNAALVKMTQGQLQIQENRERMARQEKENMAMRFRYGVFIGAISFLAIIGFALYYIGRLKKKKERQLMLQEQKIRELAYQSTREALVHARTKLDNLTREVKEKNDIIQQLQQKKNEQANAELLQELKASIILTDTDWKEYQQLFEQAYPDFLYKLKQDYPQLSPAELRCLCLEKLQLFNKEMAAVLGVSANTVMVTKHRIRKKLKLDNQEALHQLIRNL